MPRLAVLPELRKRYGALARKFTDDFSKISDKELNDQIKEITIALEEHKTKLRHAHLELRYRNKQGDAKVYAELRTIIDLPIYPRVDEIPSERLILKNLVNTSTMLKLLTSEDLVQDDADVATLTRVLGLRHRYLPVNQLALLGFGELIPDKVQVAGSIRAWRKKVLSGELKFALCNAGLFHRVHGLTHHGKVPTRYTRLSVERRLKMAKGIFERPRRRFILKVKQVVEAEKNND
jgi:hypothetical protein